MSRSGEVILLKKYSIKAVFYVLESMGSKEIIMRYNRGAKLKKRRSRNNLK